MKNFSFRFVFLAFILLFMTFIPQADAAKPVPGINVETTINRSLPLVAGGTVTYTFTVTNTGKSKLYDVAIANSLEGLTAVYQSGDRRGNGYLESREAWIYTATWPVEVDPNPLVNTVTVTANYRSGKTVGTVSDTDGSSFEVVDYGFIDPLTSPNPTISGWFGHTVAVGDGLIVVGAINESPDGLFGAGRAYVFDATDRTFLFTLESNDPEADGKFGYSVAAGDGVIVVGAPYETSSTYQDAGNVYVFDAEDGSLLTTLTSQTPESNGWFGYSVAVGAGVIAVGAPHEFAEGNANAGKVYIFDAVGYSATLTSPNAESSGNFGYSVAMDTASPGSEQIIVSAPYEDIASATNAGKVYVYGAAGLTVQDTLQAPTPVAYTNFGGRVAADSGIIVVSAWRETAGGNEGAGKAYVFNAGIYQDTLQSLAPEANAFYGYALAVGDGLIAVGAMYEDGGGYVSAGRTYVYTASTGALYATLESPNQPGYSFGCSVAVGEGIIAIGTYESALLTNGDGRVYIYIPY